MHSHAESLSLECPDMFRESLEFPNFARKTLDMGRESLEIPKFGRESLDIP